MSRRLRNGLVEEAEALGYRTSNRNRNARNRDWFVEDESPRVRHRNRPKRTRRGYDDY